jgi:VCBS repeat-containing protein
LIANDSDPENDTLSVISASTPTHGTLSLNPSAMTVFTNLTNNGATDTRADWSPDGSKIAFDTNRDGNNEIYVMNADGTGLVRMTNNSADDSQAAWSPDGSKITFMSNRSGTYEIWVMNASDGSGLTQLTNVGGSTVSGQPVWSPDGSKIAFTSDRAGGSGFEIYVMDANGANVTRLTSASGDDSEPVWSPDGSKIAFYSNRDGNTEIYVMNADGMGQTRLTSNGGIDRSPVWSLDGSKIAFISNRSGTNQIYIMDANGSNQTAVTSVPSAVTFPDWSPDGQKLLFTYNNEIQTANVNFDGAFIYTPNAGYTGSDSFTYTIIDGNGHTSVATVSINVNLVNVAPITTLVALTSIAEDNGPRLITQAELLVNAIDLNGDSLSATGLAISSGSGTLLDNGNGTWTYTSAINDNSSVSFIYTVSDGSLTAPGSATLDITPVNDAPTAANDTVNATEDTLYSGTLPAANDVDGDPLSYALSGQAAQGTVAVNAGGTFSYTPNANFNGTDSFSYTVSDDNGGSNTYVVTVNVAPVNDASVANNDAHSGSEDTTINGDVLANDSDVEGDSLTAALVSGPAHGALTLNSDGSFIFTPNTNWSGTDTFSYKANDGTQDSTIATVTLTVSPVNDAPSFTSPAATMATEDVPFSYSITTADPDTGASLIITAPILPAWLTLTDNGDGTATLSGTPTNAEVGSHSVVLQVSDGSLSASQSFTITVSNANDAPTASNSSFGTLEDTSQSGLLPVATDIDGDPVTYSLNTAASYGVTVVNADGSYTYTPNANYYGSDSFTFMVSDGQGGSNAYSVSVSVTSVNDAPSGTNNTVSVNEDTTYTFHTSDFGFSDPNDTPANSMLAVKIISLPSAGTLLYEGTAVATGQLIDASDIAGDELRFVPATNANGTGYANFTFQVKDNGGTANGGINFDPTPRTLTIDVTPVNDTPSFSSTAVTTATEDSAYSYNIATIDLDTGASLIITAPTLPAWLTLTDHGDGTATLSGTPTNAEVGSHGVVLQVSDGGLSATQGFTLTVNNVNNAPTAGNASFSTLEDTPLSGLLPPATDIDGDPVTYGPNTPASHGVAVVNASGGYTYTPNANYAGSDSFAFTIVDGSGGSNTYVVTLNVTPINDAPVLSTNLPSIEPGQTHVIATSELQATDPDNTATQLNYVLTSAPANGTLTLNGLALVLNNTFTQADVDSGRISYTNTNTASTSDAFAVSVTDTQGAATPNTPIVFLINQPVAPPVDAGAPVAPLPAPTLPPAEVAPELPATPPAAEPDAPASEAAPELAPIPLATTPADEQSAGNEAGPVSAAGRSASAPAGAHMMQSAYLQTISLTLPKAGSESATPLLSSLVRALDAISTDTHAMEALQVSLGNNSFQQQLNSLQNDINHQLHLDKTTVASSLVVSTGLSVGYVLWLVRGGVLLSSLLSTLPAWRLIDPLPILGYLDRGKRGSDEDDSLEGMLKKSADRDAAVGKPPVSGESVEPTNRAP